MLTKTAIDAPASIDKEAVYGAWGEPVEVSAADKPRHQFVDFEPDAATGYYYMGARVYDPTLRRWLSPDPLMMALPEVDTVQGMQLNLYSYVGNNPTGRTDPSGLCYCVFGENRDPGVGAQSIGELMNKNGAAVEVGAGAVPYAGDYISGGFSLFYFLDDPSTRNGVNLGLDVVGAALPFVPALGTLNRIGGEVAEGTVTKVGKKFHQKELDFANELAEAGYDVKAFGKNRAGPDFEIGGVLWEYKKLNSAGENAFKARVKKGVKQGERVIIDGRDAGLDVGDAEEYIEDLVQNGRVKDAKEIQVLGKDGNQYRWTRDSESE